MESTKKKRTRKRSARKVEHIEHLVGLSGEEIRAVYAEKYRRVGRLAEL